MTGRIEAFGNDLTGEFVGDGYGNLHGVTAPWNTLTFCAIQVADGRERQRGERVRHFQWSQSERGFGQTRSITSIRKEPTAVKKTYHIVTRAARESAEVIEQFCQANGQILLPIVNLIQNAQPGGRIRDP
jgi:hypothetical protein